MGIRSYGWYAILFFHHFKANIHLVPRTPQRAARYAYLGIAMLDAAFKVRLYAVSEIDKIRNVTWLQLLE